MTLSAADRALCRLSAAIAVGDWDEIRALRRGAAPAEGDAAGWRAWREAVLQSHLFAGFPRAVEAAGVLALEGGLGEPDAGEADPAPDDPEGGAALFERIYAGAAERVRAELALLHPLLERWILGHAYGRVLARPGLDPARRELLAVAALAALGQDRQLASHARGALRCGATPAAVGAAVDAVADLLGAEAAARARRVVLDFARRTDAEDEDAEEPGVSGPA